MSRLRKTHGAALVAAALLAFGLPAARSALAAPSTVTAPAEPATGEVFAPVAPPKLIAVADIKDGMTGYGLTVFQGTKPERFAVRVIGVLHHFLPQQDLILIISDDPRLIHSGVTAGMSGSPIYITTPEGDRLAGALAYGVGFAKDPIAGVTPIGNMIGEMLRPLRGREHTPVAMASNDAPALPRPIVPSTQDRSAPQLVPVAVPLSMSGFTPSIFNELAHQLEPWNIMPMAAGGTARAGATGPSRFEPGSAISVELIRGDMSAAGTGTVTYVDGEKVLAFGHPLFNLGEIYLPISTAQVHTIMSSLNTSFKMASPMREVGSLLQDRQSCIVGDTGQRADMIPVHVKVNSAGKKDLVFNAEVIRHRFLTPMLASAVVGNAAQASASDVSDATITVHTSLGVKGFRPLDFVDHAFSIDGVSQRTLTSMMGMKAIGEILFNPFTPANLERIDVEVQVDYKADVAEIIGAAISSDTLEPGSRPSLRVTLRPYNGAEYTESVPIEIPRSLAGQMVKIEVAAGNLVKPEQAPPENFGGLMDNLRKSYPARSLVVSLQAPDDTLALRGSVVAHLPGSVLDTLKPGASTRRAESFKETARSVTPMKVVILGKQEIQVRVKDEQPR